nr:DUF1877 family protein [Treponema sp.]
MGMCGNYIAVEEKGLKKIKKGKADLFALSSEEGRLACDIDKAWWLIGWTLTDEAGDGEPPAGYVVPLLRAQSIESDGLDYGANWLTAAQVREAAAYLADIDEVKLRSMYDHDFLVTNEVYGVHEDDAEGDFDYIKGYVFVLRDFYKQAADANKAVVFWVC